MHHSRTNSLKVGFNPFMPEIICNWIFKKNLHSPHIHALAHCISKAEASPYHHSSATNRCEVFRFTNFTLIVLHRLKTLNLIELHRFYLQARTCKVQDTILSWLKLVYVPQVYLVYTKCEAVYLKFTFYILSIHYKLGQFFERCINCNSLRQVSLQGGALSQLPWWFGLKLHINIAGAIVHQRLPFQNSLTHSSQPPQSGENIFHRFPL